ncbi:MAG: hypothetical protein HOV81_39600 [Kofleriaceae bacterium]|nr:hypothetical protein [Kofleriaceae bacterium]
MHRGVVVAVGALVGCGRIGFDASDGSGRIDAPACTVTPRYVTSACLDHDGGAQASLAVALPAAIPAGTLVVASLDYDDLNATVSISDTLGSTFVPASAAFQSTRQTAQTFHAIAPADGTDTITASWSASIQTMTLFVHAYSGIDLAQPLVNAAGKLGSSRTLMTDPIAVAAHELVVAHGNIVNVGITGAGPDLTVRQTCNDNMTADLVAAAAGSVTPMFDADGAAPWIVTATTYRPAVCP